MRRSAEEIAQIESFGRSYLRGQTATMRAIERRVCGCDYGGTSWTTREEADEVGRRLGLGPEKTLLEIGAGSGWPALYLAKIFGCDATLVDLPFEGIRIAIGRAATDLSPGSCRGAVGDGAALPFLNQRFDAVSHSDVLCCLKAKAAVLSECRRVVRDHGAMVFSVISISAGASAEQVAAAVSVGPPYIEAECGYAEMLEQTGWRVTEHVDLSAEFANSTRLLIKTWKKNEITVKPLVGKREFDDYIMRKTNTVPLIDKGTIRRELFSATPTLS